MGQCYSSSADDGPVLELKPSPNCVLPGEATIASSSPSATLALAGGCFWGLEKFIKTDFQRLVPGSIRRAKVGFVMVDPRCNNSIQNPTYQQVASGKSGYVEALWIELVNPNRDFENLIRFFFSFHDPTQQNRQGGDRGPQYGSYIFTTGEKQAQISNQTLHELQQEMSTNKIRCYRRRTVQTKVLPLSDFVAASSHHQDYLSRNPNGYCNHHVRMKNQKPKGVTRSWSIRAPALPLAPFAFMANPNS